MYNLMKSISVIAVLSGLSACGANDDNGASKAATNEVPAIFEPSGITALPDGRLLIIEDESAQPINILNLDSDGKIFRNNNNQSSLLDKMIASKLEDLEGIASDDAGHYFAVTSHSKTEKGNLSPARKKLLRFELQDSQVINPVEITNLKKQIRTQYPPIKAAMSGPMADLNIEGLSYHRQDKKLMIGLRSPVIEGKAVVVMVTNPDQAFAANGKITFASEPVYLKLSDGGIRAMAYDETLGGYLIVSRKEGKKSKPFKLWLWDGTADDKPQRIRFDDKIKLDNVEGIAPITSAGTSGLMIVRDDGNLALQKAGHYAFIPYNQLKIGKKKTKDEIDKAPGS